MKKKQRQNGGGKGISIDGEVCLPRMTPTFTPTKTSLPDMNRESENSKGAKCADNAVPA